ncbi:MAG: extracellular solute-binding protein, partial [Anaerolineales bacterium]
IESPSTDYTEVFDSAVLAAGQGNPPDIVQVDESLTQIAIDSQLFQPISAIASEEQLAEKRDDLLPIVTEFFTLDEDLWSIPWNSSNPIFYYNRDLFEAAGLDPDSPPTTYDEMLEQCAVIMAAELDGVTACANWPLVSWFVEQWLAMQGEPLLNNENGRSARASEVFLQTEAAQRIFNWWAEMAENGYYQYTGQAGDYNGEGFAFLSQTTAMHINSTAGISLLEAFSQAQGWNLGIAPLPRPTADADSGVTVGGGSLFVMDGISDAETQAAVDFIFYLTNTENMAIWHQGTGYYPNTQSAIDLTEEQGFWEENPGYRIALDQALNSEPSPATAGIVVGPAAAVRSIIEETVQSIIDADEDVNEALLAAEARINEELADYNALFAE